MDAIRLTAITIYPLKGWRGVTCAHAKVETRGLAGDRRWMVVDAAGRFISQREVPRMAIMTARLDSAGVFLTAAAEDTLYVAVPPHDAPRRLVSVWRDAVPAVDGGDAAATWLERTLGMACRLVFQADDASRPVDADHARAGDVVSFADGYPLLLTSEESLADLNARLEVPIGMERFRPNLVVRGASAWAEDSWRRVRIGSAAFLVVKPCDRCIVTTVDQATGTRPDPQEPLRTLKTFRRDARGRVYFGQNLVPEGIGRVSVGDRVSLE